MLVLNLIVKEIFYNNLFYTNKHVSLSTRRVKISVSPKTTFSHPKRKSFFKKTRVVTLRTNFHERSMGAPPSNSYRTRGGCNSGVEVYPLVVARRRSTAGRRGQKRGGAPWRHVAGGPTAPTHPRRLCIGVHVRVHRRAPWVPSLGSFHRERLRHSLTGREGERERERERSNTERKGREAHRRASNGY